MAMRYYTLLVAIILTIGLIAGSAFTFPNHMMVGGVPPSGSSPPPGTIACDVGPPYAGTVPAAATQAGFTHCSANYDFTQTQSFTNSGTTYTWSSLASWFTCSNAVSDSTKLFYASSDGVPCDTNHQNITTDGGTQVLALSYLLADKNAGHYRNEIDTAAASASPVGFKVTFPSAYYFEEVIKTTNTSPCTVGQFCIYYDASTLGLATPGFVYCVVSADFDEASNGASTVNTGLAGWNLATCNSNAGVYTFGPGNSVQSPAPSTTSYTTYGNLVTADDCGGNCTVNTGNFSQCNYSGAGAVSGLPASSFNSCVSWSVVPSLTTEPVFHKKMYMYLESGPYSSGQGGNVWTATANTVYTQRITIWSCGLSDCFNNPVITTHP